MMFEEKDKNPKGEHDNHVLELTLNGKKYEWIKQYITGAEIRILGHLAKDEEIFLAVKKPWEDELITDETSVNLARPGLEHFYSIEEKVTISIDDKKYEVKRGTYSENELKKIGNVSLNYDLDEVIDGVLTPLKPNIPIFIKGGEVFFSHPKDGVSS